ncbi:hypothetical protein DFH08DRAFT_1035964 [Mycena albidolilacea]|uniref:Uncharacterized protein n=1 Tax=Mycena albidolilacea TaxID=1033008 RepID=A0AAD6ZEJ7_9AGAR|nr:hypothetical protein DFH08DRAFT_1035964 [Mycena albidolilacea]
MTFSAPETPSCIACLHTQPASSSPRDVADVRRSVYLTSPSQSAKGNHEAPSFETSTSAGEGRRDIAAVDTAREAGGGVSTFPPVAKRESAVQMRMGSEEADRAYSCRRWWPLEQMCDAATATSPAPSVDHDATPLLIAASSQAQARSQWCDYDEVSKHGPEQGGREYKCSGKAGAQGCRTPRHPRAPPCSCAAHTFRAVRPRLPCPYPYLACASTEGVEPARIDTTSADVPTPKQDPEWNLEMPQTPSHSTPRRAHEHGHGYRAPHWLLHTRRRRSSALAHRACARESTPASPTAPCIFRSRPPDGPLLRTPFVLRTVRTAHVCTRPGPLHQLSRPHLEVDLVYRSSAQVAVPHVPFLGADPPAELVRVSRFIRSHTKCIALASRLASSTAPRASHPPAWPLLVHRLSCALCPPCWRPRSSRPPRSRPPPISVHLRRTLLLLLIESSAPSIPLCSLDVPAPFFWVSRSPLAATYIRGAVGPPHLPTTLARANLPRLRRLPHAHLDLARPTGRSCTRRLSCAPCPPHMCVRAQVRCIRSPALASTSASSTAAPPKWPFHTRRFSVQPPRSRAYLGSSDRTPSVPYRPRLEIGLVHRTTRIASARLAGRPAPFLLRAVPALLASTFLASTTVSPTSHLCTPSPYTATSAH